MCSGRFWGRAHRGLLFPSYSPPATHTRKEQHFRRRRQKPQNTENSMVTSQKSCQEATCPVRFDLPESRAQGPGSHPTSAYKPLRLLLRAISRGDRSPSRRPFEAVMRRRPGTAWLWAGGPASTQTRSRPGPRGGSCAWGLRAADTALSFRTPALRQFERLGVQVRPLRSHAEYPHCLVSVSPSPSDVSLRPAGPN